MIINHNIAALNTYNRFGAANKAQSGSMEKLSSGQRINKAGDDAAGLAISEKMRGQIRGLDMSVKNANDTTSLINTAEGALNETHSILQRMRELSVQSANDTNTVDDRNEIQKEVSQLTSEIDRIANTTEFNTKKLLNGDSGTKVIFGSNSAVAGATSTNDKIASGTYAVAVTTAAAQATTTGSAFADAAITAGMAGNQTISVNGTAVSFNVVSGDAATTASNFISAANSAGLGISATGTNAAGVTLTTNEYGADKSISITASALTAAMGLTTNATTATTVNGTNVAGTINGAAATGTGRTLLSTAGGSIGLKVTLTGTAAAATGAKGNVDVTKNSLTAQIGANENQTMTISINSMNATDLSVASLDLTTQTGASNAITTVDDAIKTVSGERAKLGAYTNRLEHTMNNLGTASENLTAAESRIRDVDMAKEMMTQTKNSILSQAAQAMLAQANSAPKQVLQLLQ